MSENPKITMQVISYQYALIGKHKTPHNERIRGSNIRSHQLKGVNQVYQHKLMQKNISVHLEEMYCARKQCDISIKIIHFGPTDIRIINNRVYNFLLSGASLY